MALHPALNRLSNCLARLPGIGRRTAERMAIRLVLNRDGLLSELAAALQEADSRVRCCSRCGSVTAADADPCRLCTDPSRDGALLCVVEEPADIGLLEQSGAYRGRYHALLGKLSPMRGQGPEDLRVRSLLDRVRREGFREVMLAVSTDMEGDATAGMLSELLRAEGVAVSRLASGLPVRSGLTYSDPVTLARAVAGRQEV